MALKTTDAVLRLVGVRNPEVGQNLSDQIPVLSKIVRAFLVDEPTLNAKSVQKFYERLAEVQAHMATVRELGRQNRGGEAGQLAKESTSELIMYRDFLQTGQAIAELRNALNVVRSAKQIPLEEREQRALTIGRAIRKMAAVALEKDRLVRDRLRPKDEEPIRTRGFGVTIESLPIPP